MNSISSQSSMSASKSPQTTLTNYATNSSLNELEKEFVQSKTKGASDDIRVGDDQLRDDPGFSLREFEDPQAVGVARGGSRIAESAKSSPTTQAASMSSLEASKNITSRGNLSITESLDAEKAATTKSKSRNSSDSSTRATGLEATKSQAKEGLSAVSADLASKAPTTSTAPAVLTPAVAKIAGSTSRESHDAKDSEKRKLDDELAAVSGYDFLLVGIVIVIVFGLIGVNVRRRRTRRPPHGHSPHSRFEDHPADEAGGKSFVETLYSFVSSSGSESLVEGPHRYLSGESWSHIGQEGRVRSKSPPPPYHQLGYGSTQSRQPASGRNILPPVRRRDNEQRLAVSPVTVGSRASIGASAAESTASEGWGDWGDEV
ncbi:hypothetical protein DFJ73DRAFT_76943 [Zopfochytrium polystomum]|nr:hypothetical protein DFJ73DRAFT_76943 [Zopfochytrium polystomum]